MRNLTSGALMSISGQLCQLGLPLDEMSDVLAEITDNEHQRLFEQFLETIRSNLEKRLGQSIIVQMSLLRIDEEEWHEFRTPEELIAALNADTRSLIPSTLALSFEECSSLVSSAEEATYGA